MVASLPTGDHYIGIAVTDVAQGFANGVGAGRASAYDTEVGVPLLHVQWRPPHSPCWR